MEKIPEDVVVLEKVQGQVWDIMPKYAYPSPARKRSLFSRALSLLMER